MPSSFSIAAYRFATLSQATLRDEIRTHTGCDEEASSILRGIERLGSDVSIRCYEVSPRPAVRRFHGTAPVSWSVRAIRQ